MARWDRRLCFVHFLALLMPGHCRCTVPLHMSCADAMPCCRPAGFCRTHRPSRQCLPSPVLQVTTAILKSGTKLDCSLVLVGTGARPNTDLFQGQLDLLEGPPGGIVVNGQLQVRDPPAPTPPHPPPGLIISDG